MAVAFDAVGPSSSGTAGTTATLAWSHTVTGSGTVLLAAVACDVDATTISSVTYGAAAMTPLFAGAANYKHSNAQTAGWLAVFKLVGAAAGTATITVTLSGASAAEGGSLSFNGADTVTGIGTPQFATGAGTPATMSFTPSTSGNIIAAFLVNGLFINSATAPSTSRFINNTGGSNAGGNIAGATSPSTGSAVTTAWTVNADWYAIVTAEVLAPGAAPAAGPPAPRRAGAGPGRLSPMAWQYLAPVPALVPVVPAGTGTATAAGAGSVTAAATVIVPATAVAAGSVTASAGTPYLAGLAGSGAGYFADQYGKPRMWVGDEIWALITNAGRWNSGNYQATFDSYFATRAGQGFTICYSDMFGSTFIGGAANGQNWAGTTPFTSNNPSSGLNATYWQVVDYALNSALANGITIALSFGGHWDWDVSGNAMFGFTGTQYQAAGNAIGTRYKNQPNLIWLIMDDYFSSFDSSLSSLLTGLRASGDTHPIAIENYSETTSRFDLPGSTSLAWGAANTQYNFGYSYSCTYLCVEYMFAEASPLTPFYGDGYFYQGGSTYDASLDRAIRQDAWWALTSGARGFNVGDEALWQWPSSAPASVATQWYAANNTKNIRTFMEGLPGWQTLAPATGSTLITAGRGTRATQLASGGGGGQYEPAFTNGYVSASRTPDGGSGSSLAVLYLPVATTITIDQTKIVSGYTATWVDPVTCATSTATVGSTYNSTAKGNNSRGAPDWVLVLQGAPVSTGTAAAAGAGSVTAKATVIVPAAAAAAAAVTAAVTQAAVATAAGAAAESAAATEIAPASAAGAAAITAVVTGRAGASPAAASTVTAVTTQIAPASAAGAGAVTAVAAQRSPGSAAGAGAAAAVATQAAGASAAGAGAVTAVATAKMATLTDAFPGAAVNAALWSSFGTATVSGGTLTLTDVASSIAYAGIQSLARYDLTGSYLLVNLPSAGGQYATTQAVLQVYLDASNTASIMVSSGSLLAQTQTAGTFTTQGSITYSATSMAWLRIRESGGTLFFDYGPDGSGWTNLASVADPWAMTSLQAVVEEGQYGGADPQAASTWDNLNLPQAAGTGAAAAAGSVTAKATQISGAAAAGAGSVPAVPATQIVTAAAAGAGGTATVATQIAGAAAAGAVAASAKAVQAAVASAAAAGSVPAVPATQIAGASPAAASTVTAVTTQIAGASAAGAAAVTAAGSVAGASTAAVAGAGAAAAVATQIAPATTAGAATVPAVPATQITAASAAGTGLAGPSPATQIAPATAAGAATAADVATQIAAASATAAGSVTAAGAVSGQSTAAVAGAAAVTAVVTQITPGAAAGAGAVSGVVTQAAKASAAAAGAAPAVVTQAAVAAAAGVATSAAVVTQAAPASAAGAGSVTAAGSVAGQSTGAAAAASSVTAVAGQAAPAAGAGAGASVTVATQIAGAAAVAAGSVTAAGSVITAGVTATAAGAAAVTAAATQAVTGTTAAGAAAVTAAATRPATATATAASAVTAAGYITGTASVAGAAAAGAKAAQSAPAAAAGATVLAALATQAATATLTAAGTATAASKIQLAFTIGILTGTDKPAAVLTAAGASNALTASTAPRAALTAATTRTGGPS